MNKSYLIGIWAILLIVLFLRFFLVFTAPTALKPGDTISFIATLYQEPKVKGNVARFEVSFANARIEVWAPRFPEYHYGDRLAIIGKLDEQVLSKNRHDLKAYFPKIEAKESTHGLALLGKVRQHMLVTIDQFLPANSAALLSGIFLGAKESLSQGFFDALRNTGTLHVVAASGMNVTLLASFLMTLFLPIFSRRISAVLIIAGILFYMALASFEPSIVRASLMGILAFTASILNRGALAALGLLIACYSMLLFDPKLTFDIGFQLSFAATAGLLFLKPLVEHAWHWFSRVGTIPVIGDSFTTTVVAQIATLPILLSNFGTISPLSIVVNTLVLWTVQPIMALGIVAAIISIAQPLSFVPLMATIPLLTFFEKVVVFFDRPGFLIHMQIPFIVGLGYYFLLMALYMFLRKRSAVALASKGEAFRG